MPFVHPRSISSPLLALTCLALVAGCSADEVNLDEAIVLSLPSDTLTARALHDILMQAPEVPGEDASIGTVSIWADLALITNAVSTGMSFTDDATIALAVRPVMMETSIQRFGSTRAGTVTPTATQVDSVARGTNVRVFRRYIIAGIPASDSARLIAEGRRLLALKERAIADGSPAAAIRNMGDGAAGIEVSAAVANTRQELPEQIAAALWRLGENELSDPIGGEGGIQLFERVPNASAREAVAAWLAPVLQRRADGAYIDSIVASRNLVVAEDGASRMRDAAVEPGRFASDAPLITWTGGELSTTEARTWLALIPAPERARMRLASDTGLAQTLNLMARREILFDLAVANGVDTVAVLAELIPIFRERLTTLMADAQGAGDPTVWFREVLEGRRRFSPLPGALPMVLRDRTEMTVNDEARIAATREAARTWRAPGASPQP